MNRTGSTRAETPTRLGVHSPPSILIVAQEPDLRAFLRASLQQWYQVAETSDDGEALQHLEHCPPQALIVGPMAASEEETLAAALRNDTAPPVLKLWSSCPPAGWATKTLRHPFMRVDLLRAVNQLVHAGEERPAPTVKRRNGTAPTPT